MPYNSVTGSTQMGGMIPVEYSKEIFSAVLEESALLRLAQQLPDMPTSTTVMSVQNALAYAYFVTGETGLKQTTNLGWEGKTITAEEIACIVPMPMTAIDDNQYPIWDMIRPQLVRAIGATIDAAGIFGTNKPTTWPTALVTAAAAAGNAVTFGTGSDIFADLFAEDGVFSHVEESGYDVTGSIGDIGLKSKLRGLRTSTGEPLFMRTPQSATPYELDGSPLAFPKNGSMDKTVMWLIGGDWSQLVWATRQDMTWKMSEDGVITDQSGSIVWNLFQQDMVALRVVMRLGFQIANPIQPIATTAATRYPFATLIP